MDKSYGLEFEGVLGMILHLDLGFVKKWEYLTGLSWITEVGGAAIHLWRKALQVLIHERQPRPRRVTAHSGRSLQRWQRGILHHSALTLPAAMQPISTMPPMAAPRTGIAGSYFLLGVTLAVDGEFDEAQRLSGARTSQRRGRERARRRRRAVRTFYGFSAGRHRKGRMASRRAALQCAISRTRRARSIQPRSKLAAGSWSRILARQRGLRQTQLVPGVSCSRGYVPLLAAAPTRGLRRNGGTGWRLATGSSAHGPLLFAMLQGQVTHPATRGRAGRVEGGLMRRLALSGARGRA